MNDETDGPIVTVRRDGTLASSWGPARGSRPPFRKGNMANLRHGAYSARIVESVAVEVAEELKNLLLSRSAKGDIESRT